MSTNNKQFTYDRDVSLGHGGFGSVFPGEYKGSNVAVKRVQLHLVNDNEEKALKCLQQLGHPNIVKLLYSENDDNFKYFILERCTASLDQLILNLQNYKGFIFWHHLTVFLQLASGLEYIHSNDLFHRDIKPSNVLIFVDFTTRHGHLTMKWADFGLSKFVNERGTCELSGIKGHENWLAPELLRSPGKSKRSGRGTVKSDVFAFALVIGYLLLDGQHLYGSDYNIPVNILNKSPVNMDKIGRSHYAHDLLTKMLKDEPGERISSTQVVKQLETMTIEIVKKEVKFRELCMSTDLNLNQIKLLIQNGIDVNGKDNDGMNALHLLCRGNSSDKLIDAIHVLIQNGIDVNGKDNNGWNALHFLCRFNASENIIDAIQLLIHNGIDTNGKNDYGWNALHWLCRFNSSEKLIDAMQILIANGVDVNGKDNNGWNALHFLCRFNSSENIINAMQFLIENGIQSNGIDMRSLLRENRNIIAETIEEIVQLLDRAFIAN